MRIHPASLFLGTLFASALMACGGGGGGDSDSGTTKSSDTQTDTIRYADATGFGTYARPFAVDSPWNSYPVSPVLGTATIPTDTYAAPAIANGSWSVMFAQAGSADAAMTIYEDPDIGYLNTVYHQDLHSITIPHWPADAVPAAAADGHLDVYDSTTGTIHSFYKLRKATSGAHAGQYIAKQYNRSTIDGRGWGDPALFYQGARATGVPTAAGIIRSTELSDGDTQFRHALAMSLSTKALSKTQPFVFPATSADSNAATAYQGDIPEGSLMMLPPDFDVSKLTSPTLQKVARTLQTYGARVVDANTGTRFVIYVEGVESTFSLCKDYSDCNTSNWSNTYAAELNKIADALRPLASQSGWVAGNGAKFSDFSRKLRMVAGRGTQYSSTMESWRYNVMLDRIEVQAKTSADGTVVITDTYPALTGYSGTLVTPVWTGGKTYIFKVESSSADIKAKLRLIGDTEVFTDLITNGQSSTITAPANVYNAGRIFVTAPAGVSGWIRVSAVEQ